MMSDTDYQSLQIRASVTPSAESWPQPDFSTASIKGDKPTLGDFRRTVLGRASGCC